jgi:hypothetical protein
VLLGEGERGLAEALALGPALLARAEAERVPSLIASVVRGPAVVLGAAQRAGRVLRLDACAARGTPVLRRVTSGPAAYVGERAILWTLALPHVAALVPDATARTLLNRNVRGFLRGLSRAGATAHYFGREWVSVRRRPAALLGFEVSPGGAVLLEVIAGVDASVALPDALVTDDERAVDRWLGKPPAGLGELMTGEPLEIARDVSRTVALRAATPIEEAPHLDVVPVPPVTEADDPLPPGFVPGPASRVPVGWIDTALDPLTRRLWLGGDVLVPTHVRAALAAGSLVPADVPLEGASLDDLRAAVARAASWQPAPRG